MAHVSVLDEISFHPGWQWYDYLMPDGIHDIFQAPDEKTADSWASKHWAECQKIEAERKVRIGRIRKIISQSESEHRKYISRLYDENLHSGTFCDIDKSFAVEESQENTDTVKVSRKKNRKIIQSENFLDLLGL